MAIEDIDRRYRFFKDRLERESTEIGKLADLIKNAETQYRIEDGELAKIETERAGKSEEEYRNSEKEFKDKLTKIKSEIEEYKKILQEKAEKTGKVAEVGVTEKNEKPEGIPPEKPLYTPEMPEFIKNLRIMDDMMKKDTQAIQANARAKRSEFIAKQKEKNEKDSYESR